MRAMIGAVWFAVLRREDLGVVQVRFIAGERGFHFLDLRLEGGNFALIDFQVRGRELECVLARRVARIELACALLARLIEYQLRAGLIELRPEILDLGAARKHASLIDRRVDLRDQLAFLHRVADFDRDLPQLSRDLRADIDERLRTDLRERRYRFFEVALDHGLQAVGGGTVAVAAEIVPAERARDRKECDRREPAPVLERCDAWCAGLV
jgi:hypothetical protein